MSRYALRSNLAALAIAVAGAMGRAPCLPRRRSMAARRTPCMKAATTASTKACMTASISGLGPVSKKQLEQLKLDDKQQALVKTAQDSQRGLRDAMRRRRQAP